MRKKYTNILRRKKKYKEEEENMRFELQENTKVRFEKDGIYIMNSKYQTKEKISDVDGLGRIFYSAIHSEEIDDESRVESFLKKHFIVPLKTYEEILDIINENYFYLPEDF